MFLQILFLILGVFACSTAAIFIRLSSVHPVMLSALRLFVAAVVLTPLFLRDRRRHRARYTRKDLFDTIIPGLLLGIHFISWIAGIKMATVANGSLIVNLVPIAMPFFLYFLIREKLTGREWLATGIALGGTALLVACDFNLDRQYFIGDIICFVSMLFFCLYLAFSRKYRHVSSLWLYVVPLYYIAGVFCLVCAIVWGLVRDADALPQLYSGKDWLWAVFLGIIPTVIGHSILNHSMKKLRGQVVSIINMGQFVFAGTMAFLIFNEVPHWSLYAASVMLVVAALIVVTRQRPAAAVSAQE